MAGNTTDQVAVQTLDVSVSLVAMNQRRDLERLLPTLRGAIARESAEILLVDHCSTDGTEEFLKEHFPEVSVLRSLGRAGYGENHNRNIARARGRYVALMNSDMEVREGTLTMLRTFMDAHPDVGIAFPKVLNPDGSIQGLNKRLPTVWDLFLRRFIPHPLQRPFRRRMDWYEMRDVGYDSSYDLPFVSGAFMFARTDLLKALGGFDRSFFLYFEDVDLSRRVQATHRTVYVPEAAVTHFWARSTHKHWRYSYYFIRSAGRYFLRWGVRLW
jgi:GT2 family glycosyltransferase